MRNTLIAALAITTLAAPAVAQSASEVRQSQREVAHDRNEVNRHMANGDMRGADRARQELREDRRELREDWRDYRRSHPDAFRKGAYVGPTGYRYRALAPGQQLAPVYYGSRYSVANPTAYRLPQAGNYQRWVRYGNDVVLVNTRTGRVIQAYRNFYM